MNFFENQEQLFFVCGIVEHIKKFWNLARILQCFFLHLLSRCFVISIAKRVDRGERKKAEEMIKMIRGRKKMKERTRMIQFLCFLFLFSSDSPLIYRFVGVCRYFNSNYFTGRALERSRPKEHPTFFLNRVSDSIFPSQINYQLDNKNNAELHCGSSMWIFETTLSWIS